MTVDKAIILAAGEGRRMQPLTYTRPKSMLTIANRPILEHLLVELKASGVKDFFIITGYHAEQIRNYFQEGDRWGISIQYIRQKEQRGTADALRIADGLIHGNFLMANGDILIYHPDIQPLVSQTGNIISIMELPDVSGLGVVETQADRVLRFHEKTTHPPSHLANAGLYLFTPEIFPALHRTQPSVRGECEITDSLQILIDSGIPVGYRYIRQWLNFTYPWDLLTAQELVMASLAPACEGEIEPNVTLKGAVSIGKGTVIRSGAYIVGPVIIGEDCEIGPHCFIRGSTAIGHHCHIGAAVEVKNSIIMNNTKVPHLNYVGDSILGENGNLGAGTKIANLRLDKKNIRVNGLETGRRKLGAIIGDNVQTGINASINVGTLIGHGAFIGPGALASGFIPPGARILK